MSISSAFAEVASNIARFSINMTKALFGLDTSRIPTPKTDLKPLDTKREDFENSTPTSVLGGIYQILVKSREFQKNQKKIDSQYENAYKEREIKRTEAIIKALSIKRPKKVKVEPTKKKEEVEAPPKEKAPPKKKTPPKEEAPPKEKLPTKKEEPTKVEAPPKPTKPEPPPKPEKVPTKPPEKAPPVKIPPAVVTGAAVTGLLVGKEALAANISKYESRGDYNAYNKGTVGNRMIASDKPIDFSKMTITEYLRRGSLPSGDPDRIFAVGKYQIIPNTMKDLVKKLKIDPDTTVLDKNTQDLLFSNGLIKQTRKKVEDYITGKSDDRDGAILQLAQEFASVGIPYDMTVGNKKLKKGDSYYSGIGGNKAHNPPEEVGAALDADRLKNVSKTSNANIQPPSPTVATEIESKTKENQQLKENMKVKRTPMRDTTNIILPGEQTEEEMQSPKVVDDRNIYQIKSKK